AAGTGGAAGPRSRAQERQRRAGRRSRLDRPVRPRPLHDGSRHRSALEPRGGRPRGSVFVVTTGTLFHQRDQGRERMLSGKLGRALALGALVVVLASCTTNKVPTALRGQ